MSSLLMVVCPTRTPGTSLMRFRFPVFMLCPAWYIANASSVGHRDIPFPFFDLYSVSITENRLEENA